MIKKLLFSLLVLSVGCFNQTFAKAVVHHHHRVVVKHSYELKNDTINYCNHVWGVDMSHHQSLIDWELLDKTDKPQFMFLKVTEGTTIVDSKYNEHANNARKRNIPCGAYHFFSYQSDGQSQARYFMQHANIQKGDLHPVLDVEYTKRTKHARMNITKEIKAFCAEVYKCLNVYPIIYCNEHFYKQYLKEACKDFNYWICNYRKEPNINWVFWQRTDRGKVNGINGRVDKNTLNPNKKIEYYVMQ